MNSITSKLTSMVTDKTPNDEEIRILILGVEGTGHTTLLKQLNLGEITTTNYAIGFYAKTIRHRNVEFMSWDDLCINNRLIPLKKKFWDITQGLILIVDSTDQDRDSWDWIDSDMTQTLSYEALKGVPVLVLANKQDLPGAESADAVSSRFQFRRDKTNESLVQPICAVTGKGVKEGVSWLQAALQKRGFLCDLPMDYLT